MPGSAQNPWATELKTRKKSVPRKRSVHTNGNKGNENTDDVNSKVESNDNDVKIHGHSNASQKDTTTLISTIAFPVTLCFSYRQQTSQLCTYIQPHNIYFRS